MPKWRANRSWSSDGKGERFAYGIMDDGRLGHGLRRKPPAVPCHVRGTRDHVPSVSVPYRRSGCGRIIRVPRRTTRASVATAPDLPGRRRVPKSSASANAQTAVLLDRRTGRRVTVPLRTGLSPRMQLPGAGRRSPGSAEVGDATPSGGSQRIALYMRSSVARNGGRRTSPTAANIAPGSPVKCRMSFGRTNAGFTRTSMR